MAFDVEAAKKAGYTNAEIAEHLAAESGYDLAGALAAGYTHEQVIHELSLHQLHPGIEAALAKKHEGIEDPFLTGALGAAGGAGVLTAEGLLKGALKTPGAIRDAVVSARAPKAAPTPTPEAAPRSEGAVKNWTRAEHSGEYYGGRDYEEADKFAKEAKSVPERFPGYKVPEGGSRIAVEERSIPTAKPEPVPSMMDIARGKVLQAVKPAPGMVGTAIKSVGASLPARAGVSAMNFQEAENRAEDNQPVRSAVAYGGAAAPWLGMLSKNPRTRALVTGTSAAIPFVNRAVDAVTGHAAGGLIHLSGGGGKFGAGADFVKGYLQHTPTKPHPDVGSRFTREVVGKSVPDIALDLETKKGASILPKPWDNLSANYKLTSVSGTPLTTPLTTHGGRGWVQELANYNAGSGGASDIKIVNRINKRAKTAAQEAEQAGGTGEVLHAPMTMDPVAGMNYSGFPALAIHDLMKQREFNPEKMQQFNEMVRGSNKYGDVSGFVGFDDPRFKQQLLYGGYGLNAPAGDLRKAVADRMSLAGPQKEIGYNIEDLVGGLADPKLVHTPRGHLGGSLIQANPDAPLVQTGNPIYPVGYGGKYIGGASDMPVDYLLPKTYARLYEEMQSKYPDKHPNALRAMAIGAIEKRNAGVSEVIDNQVLDNYGKFMEGIKSGEFDPNDLGAIQQYMATKKFAEGGEVQYMAEGKIAGHPRKSLREIMGEHKPTMRQRAAELYEDPMVQQAAMMIPKVGAPMIAGQMMGDVARGDYDTAANNAGMMSGLSLAHKLANIPVPKAGALGPLSAAAAMFTPSETAPRYMDEMPGRQGNSPLMGSGSVMEGYVPHMAGGGDVVKSLIKRALGSGEGVAARTIEGSPHTYPPIAEGPWMREYRQSGVGTGLPTTPEEWEALAQARQAAQNKVDYLMGDTGPNKPDLVQYWGKYRRGTPEERAAQQRSDDDTIRMLMKMRGLD